MSEARKLWIVEVRRECQVVVLADDEDEAEDLGRDATEVMDEAETISECVGEAPTIASLPIGWAEALPYLSHKEKAERTCASWLAWLAEAPERERAEHENEVRSRGLRVPDPATADLFGEAP